MEQTSLDNGSLYLRRDVMTTCLLNYVTMRLRGLFIIKRKCETLTLGDEMPMVLGLVSVSWTANFQGS